MFKNITQLIALGLALALVFGPVAAQARYLNPNTGRFQTMDSYEGNTQDPASLHKYTYCHDSPVNNADPSGQAVYVTTRPLNMAGLRHTLGMAVHVFLSFDTEGINNFAFWAALVRQLNDRSNIPQGVMGGVPPYRNNPALTTFSFHPYSVLAGRGALDQLSVVSTRGSYVAYNDPVDIAAFSRTGFGYQRFAVTRDEEAQYRLYRLAIQSRNINNSAPGTIDPHVYEFPVYNCGSWTQTIVSERGGFSYPSRFLNLGTGLGGPMAMTGVPMLMTGIGRGWSPRPNSNGGVNLLNYAF